MTTRTWPSNITRAQIIALREEAGAAGDYEQIEICNRALNGSHRAIRQCARVIRWAESMAADDPS